VGSQPLGLLHDRGTGRGGCPGPQLNRHRFEQGWTLAGQRWPAVCCGVRS